MGTKADVVGSSVVVTGAASGLGQAIAARLADDGFGVVAVDRVPVSLDEHAVAHRDGRARVIGIQGDVSDRTTHRRARDAASKLGVLAAWVGCAGITRTQDLAELDERDAREMVDVNEFGLLWSAAEAVSEWTITRTGGVFIAVSSVHAQHAAERHTVYEMTKASAEALVRSVAVTYGSVGIRAVAVAPGAIDTPALRASLASAADPAVAASVLERRSPAQRIGRADEIASVVAFLISNEAAYISGISIPIDGGWSAVLARSADNAKAHRPD